MTETRQVVVVFSAKDEGVGALTKELKAKVAAFDAGARSAAKSADMFGDSAKAAGQKGASAFSKVGASAKAATAEIRGAVKAGRGFVSSMKSVGLVGLGFSAVASSISQGARALDEWTSESLDAQRVGRNLQIDISGARAAFGGYVDDVTIAKAANKAFSVGVVETGAEFARLAAGVKAKSEALGKSTSVLLEQAVIGIANNSKRRIDDLGIVFKAGVAESMYAESLGKTVEELTALERQESFQKATLIELGRAGDEAARGIDGFSASTQQAKTAVANQKQTFLGFDDSMGNVNEALRGLAESGEITRLKFAEFADGSSDIGKEVNGMLSEWGVTLMDVKRAAEETGVSFEELLARRERAASAKVSEREAKALAAETKERVSFLEAEADEMQFTAELLGAMGEDQELITDAQIESLRLRKAAADAAGDEAKQLVATRNLDLALAKAEAGPKRGRGRGATAAERAAVAGEQRVAQLEQEAALSEAIATTAEEQAFSTEKEFQAARARIELERQVLDLTKARGKLAKQELDNQKAALDDQAEILLIEHRVQLRERELELEVEAAAVETARSSLAISSGARVVDLDTFRLKAEAQRLTNAGDLEAAARVELELIEAKTRAQSAQFDQRALSISAQDPQDEVGRLEQQDELEQLVHDREMARLGADGDMRRALDDEKQRLADADTERLRQKKEEINTWIGTVQTAQGEIMNFAGAMIQRRNQAEDASHTKEIKRMEASAAARGESFDAALDAAKGNASATAKIQRDRQRVEFALQRKIEEAEAAHQDKRQRQEMRFQGGQLLIQAAVQSAKAAAAFPRIPAMIAHGVAAGLNATYGAMLMAGNIPGGGAAASLGGGGAGAGSASSDMGSAEAPTTPDSVPAADQGPADRPRTGGLAGGGTVIIEAGAFQVLGALDDETSEKIAFGLRNAGFGREAIAS